jgi:transcription initiation factor TFIIB
MNGAFIYQDTDGNRDGTPSTSADGCPECDSDRVVADDVRGEMVCEECGCVVRTRQIDTGPEWSTFDHEEGRDRSRVGAPLTEAMHDRGLTTKIHWQNTDAQGNQLSSKKRSQFKRLRVWQERIRTNDAGERNLQLALAEINRMSSALGIPEPVREAAAVTYREALDRGLIQGRSIEAVATGSLYVACRKEDIPRSLDEFTDVSRVSRVEVGRAYRYLAAELGLEMQPVDPRQFLPRFCSALDLDGDVRQRAVEVLDVATEEGLLSGKSPTGLAGAAIYVAALDCNEKRTQAEVADVADVTEVTIRNRYQEQLGVLDRD